MWCDKKIPFPDSFNESSNPLLVEEAHKGPKHDGNCLQPKKADYVVPNEIEQYSSRRPTTHKVNRVVPWQRVRLGQHIGP
mmetsp:Transcript_5347/g.15532  ORF Transcript_5347/g.15532 Transcript_5347/m.15532 type:complete len:80 (-) Transcript_5347:57-296(-)